MKQVLVKRHNEMNEVKGTMETSKSTMEQRNELKA